MKNMKKIFITVFLLMVFTTSAYARCCSHCNSARCHTGSCYHHSSYHSGSNSVYIIRRDFQQDKSPFLNCKNHSLLTETVIYHYSDGSRRSYKKYSILNADGSVFEADCTSVKHIVHNKTHYFLIKKNKQYKIMTEDGKQVSKRNYTLMNEITEML